jgi:octanoyl-[GcvH]:protein N-octanoyltransferase
VEALRLITDSLPDEPALDTAVARATLERVAAGALPETLRLARPGRMVAFGKQDAVSPRYPEAVRVARQAGFEAVLRLGGGRAAAFHEGTVSLAHATPEDDPRPGIHERFERSAELVAAALRRLGVDARVGEVAGEYCPGGYSVNAGGRTKLAGLGQRLIAGGAHVGALIVVEGPDLLRTTLVPVYEALELDWDPATVGAVSDEVPGVTLEDVLEALRQTYAGGAVGATLDSETVALARRLAPEHRAPD